MSTEKVKKYFSKFNMEERVMELPDSSATVELAAIALKCEPSRIAKTMSFKIKDSPILIVMAGDVRIDNHKYKDEFHSKAAMLKGDEVLELTGHPIGGVCPFAINKNVTVYLDVSLKRFDFVFPACGSANSAIGLTISELEKYSGFVKWVNVTKVIE